MSFLQNVFSICLLCFLSHKTLPLPHPEDASSDSDKASASYGESPTLSPSKDSLRIVLIDYWEQCISEDSSDVALKNIRKYGISILRREATPTILESFFRSLFEYLFSLYGNKIVFCETNSVIDEAKSFFQHLSCAMRVFYPGHNNLSFSLTKSQRFHEKFGLLKPFDPQKDYVLLDSIMFFLVEHFLFEEALL